MTMIDVQVYTRPTRHVDSTSV